MNSPHLLRPLAGVLSLLLAAASALRADPLPCDRTQYRAQPGLTAMVENDVLTITWQGAANSEIRARYAIDRAQPVVRELATRRGTGAWIIRPRAM